MKIQKSIFKFQIISTIFVIILGTLLHFTYNWSNNNPLVGIFSAVNESTWEHLKLIFFPMLITIVIGTIYYKDDYENYLCTKTKGLLISLVTTCIAIVITYNQKLALQKKRKLFKSKQALKLTTINRIIILCTGILFLYINYRLYQISKQQGEDLKSYKLQISASILTIIASIFCYFI